jgi:hypothetical protein
MLNWCELAFHPPEIKECNSLFLFTHPIFARGTAVEFCFPLQESHLHTATRAGNRRGDEKEFRKKPQKLDKEVS